MYDKEIRQYMERNGFEAFAPKAVLFDMDGVLYNSMPNHAVSWHKSMAKFGLDIAPDEAYLYEGMRGVETIKLLARSQWHKELSDEEASKMYAEKSLLYSRCPVADKIEGVQQLMEKVKASGMKIVVVTGSGQRTLLDKIEQDFKGLVSKDLMITSFDVVHGKPNPEPYICGMRKAGIEPWEGIIVENAPLGVRAGVAARVFTIAVNTGPLPDKVLADEGANLIFGKMTDLRDEWENFYELRVKS
ncbi:MAG: HAD hydrolase-like protein [Prevotella sp.]|nr:HAD hydrolase-like protein [Prevotella sp.]